jgi:predicted transcriptional regulator
MKIMAVLENMTFLQATMPTEFKHVAQQVKSGETPTFTVRELLGWFGAFRRRGNVVSTIRELLAETQMETVPDIETPPLDGSVMFRQLSVRTGQTQNDVDASLSKGNGERASVEDDGIPAQLNPLVTTAAFVAAFDRPVEPRYRLSRLKAATTKPVAVKPDTSVKEAVTLMLARDFSQLPVMTSEREVKGVLSWKSLGERLAMGRECSHVRQCMSKPHELLQTDSIFDAVRVILEADFVLIRDAQKIVTGIVTASDISSQFRQLAEPFLLLGEIENQLRVLISPKLDMEDLQQAKDPADSARQINNVSDLTFGEYVRLIENPSMWDKLGWPLDRARFSSELGGIRDIRNEVMHFDPDGTLDEDLRRLREFSSFLDNLKRILDT